MATKCAANPNAGTPPLANSSTRMTHASTTTATSSSPNGSPPAASQNSSDSLEDKLRRSAIFTATKPFANAVCPQTAVALPTTESDSLEDHKLVGAPYLQRPSALRTH